MPVNFTREEIALRAQETAARLVAALGGGGLAAGFVRRYAVANRRRALLAHAARYRELIERISREALLAMAARVERDLSRRFNSRTGTRRRRRPPRGSARDAALANLFRVEFYGRLAELFDWRREELEDFWRDLDLYTGAACAPRPRKSPRGSRRRKRDQHLGAFADRCAFLLDSSLLERARRAAAKLHRELDLAAHRAVNSAFRGSGSAHAARPAKVRIGKKRRSGSKKKTKRKCRVARRKSITGKKARRKGGKR